MTTNHTRGPWRIGKAHGAVVADVPVHACLDNDHVEAYGGHLIAESIAVCNRPLIAAAPDLLAALEAEEEWRAREEAGALDPEWDYDTMVASKRRAAIAKARGAQ